MLAGKRGPCAICPATQGSDTDAKFGLLQFCFKLLIYLSELPAPALVLAALEPPSCVILSRRPQGSGGSVTVLGI